MTFAVACMSQDCKVVGMAHNAHTGEFAPGDRVFSHYVMSWGTVLDVDHGFTRDDPDLDVWYRVRMDKHGDVELLNDGGGNWDMARIVPPAVAARFGYGTDPKAAK